MRISIRCALSLLILGLGLSACSKKPEVVIVGQWKVFPSAEDAPAEDLDLKVNVRKDGTFVLRGNPMFEAMTGQREVRGKYRFVDDFKMRVEMDTQAWDYQPTTYGIQVISRGELALSAENHAVSLIRAD